jgi:SPP1 gp7 family putative phage head morphogenesis protein
MSGPFHADRVGLLYTRTFNGLKGITDAMDNQISQVLAQGLADGDNPRLLAKKLTSTISGPFGDLGITDTLGRFIPAERRAQTLARTEVIRAHHQATIQEYKNWAAERVKVKAEWVTAGYNVCPECAALEGQVFKLTEIENMIPVHPNCRCVAIPLDVTKEYRE